MVGVAPTKQVSNSAMEAFSDDDFILDLSSSDENEVRYSR